VGAAATGVGVGATVVAAGLLLPEQALNVTAIAATNATERIFTAFFIYFLLF
jgi:hypothetical protein